MPGTRIPSLTAIAGASTANDDNLVIFDTSEDTTKRILRSQLAAGIVGDLPYTPAGFISATTVPAAIAEIAVDVAASTGAALIGYAPTGTVAATTVQGAIDEVVSDLAAVTGAGLVGYTATGTVAATTVQGAINEIVSDLAASSGASLVGFIQSGTSPQATTVQSELRAIVRPEQYGAVGDGVANDTSAMTNAMTEAVSAGKRLVLRTGATYLLSSWTAFSNSGQLWLEGNKATLKGPSSTVDFLTPAANFYIQDCVFDRWNSVVERLAAQTGSFTDVRFIGNRATNCDGIAINIERPVEQYRIEDNDFDTCTGGYAVRIGTNTYADQDTWLRGWIKGNRFKTLSAASTTSVAAILVYGREVTIADNKIDGISQSGTGEAWGIYTKARYSQVYGNYVNNVVASGSGDNVGINIKGTTRAVTSSPQGFAVTVFGNHVRNIGSAGVRGTGIRAQTDDVLIFGNTTEDCGNNGIATDEATAYRNVRILHNIVRFATNTAGTVGIRMEGSGTAVTAEHNSVRNAATGIRLTTGASSSTMAEAQIVRNTIEGATNGIIFDAFSGCTLDRPIIEHNVVTDGTYGLLYNGSAGTVTSAKIRFNDTSRASTPVSGSMGTTPVVEGNVGYLTGTATWNPGSIANGASEATTLTVAGAALGNSVQASFSLALAGLALAAQVSATDTVEVRLLNNSGGSVDLGSGTIRVRVSAGIA